MWKIESEMFMTNKEVNVDIFLPELSEAKFWHDHMM